MREATLGLPVRGDPVREILLGHKKIGFGAGKYTGFGGKVEPGESVRSAAARELEEEVGIRVQASQLQERGILTFIFPSRPSWNQRVTVYLIRAWEGDPAEGAEMVPQWYAVDALPFGRMWQDARHWLPLILAGGTVRATYVFEPDNETVATTAVEAIDGQE